MKADHTIDYVKMKVANPSWAPSHQSEFPTCRKRDAAVSGQDSPKICCPAAQVFPKTFAAPRSIGSINSTFWWSAEPVCRRCRAAPGAAKKFHHLMVRRAHQACDASPLRDAAERRCPVKQDVYPFSFTVPTIL